MVNKFQRKFGNQLIDKMNILKFEKSIIGFLDSMIEGLSGLYGADIFQYIAKLVCKDFMIENLTAHFD